MPIKIILLKTPLTTMYLHKQIFDKIVHSYLD